ncbi:hypothetical protein [Azospirillum sp. sgz301742]
MEIHGYAILVEGLLYEKGIRRIIFRQKDRELALRAHTPPFNIDTTFNTAKSAVGMAISASCRCDRKRPRTGERALIWNAHISRRTCNDIRRRCPIQGPSCRFKRAGRDVKPYPLHGGRRCVPAAAES